MQTMQQRSISYRFGSQARFVAAAKATTPDAWKSVEDLKMACALDALFPEWVRAAQVGEPMRNALPS
jgi:hypothetical protein